MEIVSCPKCGHPRALGHRCPSCGDTTAPAGQQQAATQAGGSWQQATESWTSAADPWQGTVDAQNGTAGAAPHPYESETAAGLLPGTARNRPASSAKKSRGSLIAVIVALVVIAIVATVAVVLTTGGAAVVEESASVAAVPDKAHDQAAQTLLRNAMTAIDAVCVESGDYTAVTQATLQTMEPSIAWVKGSGNVASSPSAAAKVQSNAVAWVCTGPLSYELGTWSESGVAFGVRVDRMAGGATYYRGGEAGAW